MPLTHVSKLGNRPDYDSLVVFAYCKESLSALGFELKEVQVHKNEDLETRSSSRFVQVEVQVQVYIACTLFKLIQYKMAYKISRLTNDEKVNLIYTIC